MSTQPVVPQINTAPTNPVPQPSPISSDSHDLVLFPKHNVVAAIPAQIPDEQKNGIARLIHEGLQAGSTVLSSFGLPSTVEEAKQATAMLPSQIEHPLDTAEKVAQATGSALKEMVTSDPELLNKARQSWQSGQHIDAVRHFINYMTPGIGSVTDKSGDELQRGEYGKAVGHVAATVLPLLFGKAGTAEAAAEEAVTPEAAVEPSISTPRMTVRQGFAQGSALRTAASLTDAERAAAAFIAKNKLTAPAVEEVHTGNPVEDEGGVNLGGKTQQVRGAKPAQTVDIEGQNKAAADFLAKLEKQNLPKSDIDVLADIKNRLGIKTGAPINEPAATPAVQEVKTRLAAKEQANAATLDTAQTGSEGSPIQKYTVTAKHPQTGDVQGSLRLTQESGSDVTRVDNSSSELPKGSGLGTRMYVKGIKEAAARNPQGSFVSDGIVSPDARGVWLKLKDMGLPVEEIEGKGGSTFSIDLSKVKEPAAKITPDWAKEIVGVKKPVAPVPSEPTFMQTAHAAVNRGMLPSESIDLTNDWKHAVQDELAKKGVSGGSDANSPTFFSKAERVANQKVPNNASGDQILSTLKNNGVKANEIDWLGLDDYLKGKPKVSKADLQQYINEHKIALNEVDLGGNDWKNVRDLTVQRNKVYAENNGLWADHLRYADGSTDLFNAMKEGKDIEPVIAKMPADVQEPARRFVETDQQIRDFDKQIGDAEKNVKPSKYESYTLPGDKDNYTEKLLTLPPDESSPGLEWKQNRRGKWAWFQGDSQVSGAYPEQSDSEYARTSVKLDNSKTFRSSHFDEPNVLAHARYDDRPSVDGKKTLFLEELQSDWASTGKRQGYNDPNRRTALENQISELGKRRQEIENKGTDATEQEKQEWADIKNTLVGLQRTFNATHKGVPDMPFKETWHELVMKRMLRHAAENGYDRLAWTTGEQQAARYDLSKHIQSVEYYPETQTLDAYDHSGKRVMSESGVQPNRILDYIGKDAAVKLKSKIDEYSPLRQEDFSIDEDPEQGFIVRDPNGDSVYTTSSPLEAQKEVEYLVERDRNQFPTPRISGLDLKVGGEWAKALYDRAIPNFLKQYAKKWNAKVGTTDIVTGTDTDRIFVGTEPSQADLKEAWRTSAGTLHTAANNVIAAMQEGQTFSKAMDSFGTEQLAEKLGGKMQYGKPRTEKVHSIEITPQMKKSVLQEGQPISKSSTTDQFDWRAAITGRAA